MTTSTWRVPTSCSVHFGSGSGSVRLVADGVRVKGDGGGYGNGFLSWDSTALAPLRTATHIEFEEHYYPGGSKKFVGSGRHFIKWAIAKGVAHNDATKGRPEPVLCPRPVWERRADLLRRFVARVETRVPTTPAISGGKTVPYHFYTDEGRWERWPADRGEPRFNSDRITSYGSLVVKRAGVWFIAPAKTHERIRKLERSLSR